MAIKSKEILSGFDEAGLADLSEPLTVTVHKMIGSKPCPLQLPVKSGEDVPGRGLTKDEVRTIDHMIANVWAGGGEYLISASGDNGAKYRWKSYFPLDKYPEIPARVTTGNGAQAQPSAPAPTLAGVAQVVPPSPSYAPWGGLPMPVAPAPSPASSAVTSTQHHAPPWSQQHPSWPSMSYPSPYSPSPYYTPPHRDRDDDKLTAEREARLKLEAQIERDRMQAAHQAEMMALREELRRLADNKRPADDDRVRELERKLEEERRAREVESRFEALQRQMERQMEMFQRSLEQISQRPSGPDPTMMMLVEAQKAQAAAQIEAARAQADAQREAARLQADAQREAARSAIGPREMVDIMSRMSTGHDQLASAYSRAMDLQQRAVENILQAQGPAVHPALEMAGRAAEGVLGVAQQYIAMKEQAVAQESKARVMAAQLQAAQLQGPQAVAAVQAQHEVEEEVGEVDEETERELEESEELLFGPALPAVKRLRVGVASSAVSPIEAASAVLQGIDHFAKSGKTVKAFELWRQGNLAELVGVLVPDAIPSFKEQLAQALFDARAQMGR